ncbi:DUF4168 domain-containing protein [Sinomicrobium weinanense]|uniref:DUF4168 domain-containing protein n=1 Tax=Sinomicrobium weinanense TaxID=2842200 RepID=A0A926JN63_9FLAO|nr:DUF4168 domain-containing protein [Sinomicrobium weinanense]MBC9794372.1 DUF4168 domain-containing protein [Sinomicrobium weinanense]MBU3124279.1 DUF4168 domain-containing protein [Sinomicrobium weinanense]
MRFTDKLKSSLVCFLMVGITAFAQTAEQKKVEVSDDELGKIATALQGVQQINVQAQQKMMKTVVDKGFEMDRFNELYEASRSPEKNVDASAEEKEKFGVVMNEMQKMQTGFQKQMEETITKTGISLDRYQEVAMALQTDTDLQKRLQALLAKQQQ